MRKLYVFSAAWCGPCKMLYPIIHQLQQEKLNIEVIDVDDPKNESLVADYQVNALPSLVFLDKGLEYTRVIGFTPKVKIESIYTQEI